MISNKSKAFNIILIGILIAVAAFIPIAMAFFTDSAQGRGEMTLRFGVIDVDVGVDNTPTLSDNGTLKFYIPATEVASMDDVKRTLVLKSPNTEIGTMPFYVRLTLGFYKNDVLHNELATLQISSTTTGYEKDVSKYVASNWEQKNDGKHYYNDIVDVKADGPQYIPLVLHFSEIFGEETFKSTDKLYMQVIVEVTQSDHNPDMEWGVWIPIVEFEYTEHDGWRGLGWYGSKDGLTYCISGDVVYIIECDENIKDVVIPGKIKTDSGVEYSVFIDSFAFSYSNLETVVMNEGSQMTAYCFDQCTSLKSITLPSDAYFSEREFGGCTSLESIVIPEGATGYLMNTFEGCTALKTVTYLAILDSYWTFTGCTSLESIIIPEGVTSIDQCSFLGCSSLKTITLPSTITYIGGGAFDDCTSLESIIIPEGVTKIQDFAFSGCSSLKTMTLPSTLNFFVESAFLFGEYTGIDFETGEAVGYNNLESLIFADPTGWYCTDSYQVAQSRDITHAFSASSIITSDAYQTAQNIKTLIESSVVTGEYYDYPRYYFKIIDET